MSREVTVTTHSKGYRMLRIEAVDDGPVFVPVHRLVSFAEGDLEGIRADQDPREVHHIDGRPSINSAGNLEPLDPVDHGATTRAADGSRGAPDVLGVEFSHCPECSTGRPHEVRAGGSRRCCVCVTVTDPDDLEADDGLEADDDLEVLES